MGIGDVLLKLLYLFQTILAEPAGAMFQEIDKLVSRLIWQGKRPRSKYKTLKLTKRNGGTLPSTYEKLLQGSTNQPTSRHLQSDIMERN